jgi:flagellar hook-associated protein 2
MSTTSILNQVLAATTGSDAAAIDVTGAVNAILYADRAPERVWQAQQTTLVNQTAAITQIQTQASTLTDDLNALQDTSGALSASTATSTNSSVVTASALPGTSAGSHTILVESLATTASWYSNEESSSSAALGSGSFTLTSASGNRVPITTGGNSGNNTLDELAASINSKSLGVTASIITDSSGARLSLVAQNSGAAANFSISVTSGLGFTSSGTGVNAVLKVDNVPITSASNTVTGALPGVTLNLQSVSAAAVGISLSANASSITSAVGSFVSDYNTLIQNVNSQFAYNSATQTGGTLQEDSTVQAFQSALLGSTNYSSGSGTYQTLGSLGITTNQDGTLSLDSTTLSNAIQNDSSAVSTFFQGSSSGTSGFVSSMETSLDIYTDPTDGAFTVDLSSISSENTDLTNQISTLELHLSSEQTTLTASYNQADIELEQLPQILKQTNALLNPNSSSSNS